MDEEPSDRTFAPVDPTYGQRSALPDLDDENEDGTVNEALEYLRSVRYVVCEIHQYSPSIIFLDPAQSGYPHIASEKLVNRHL